MQEMIKRIVYPVDITEVEKETESIAERLNISKAEAIRDSIRHYAEYLTGLEVIEYRNITEKHAEKEIKRYLKGKRYVSADEISIALRIDMSQVNKILMGLWQKEGGVEPYER